MDTKRLIEDLMKRDFEEEWFEFKENWYNPDGIGEYISALSNSALVSNSEKGYLIWGIKDKTHKIVGTSFNFNKEIKGESLIHYITRSLQPKISFKFIETNLNGKRIVVLEIPAASKIPTSYKKERFIRIGSSKESLQRFPENEASLWLALNNGVPSLINIESPNQKLQFNSLINYYSTKGIKLNTKNFKDNLRFYDANNKYNLLAYLLSDKPNIHIRAAIFNGTKKSDPMYSVKELGMMNLLLSLEKVLDYGDTMNIAQADEHNRKLTRNDVPLFDSDVYREAILNAFVHNDWKNLNAPMITFYSNRLEILSFGKLSPKLTIEDFYRGRSEPVNKELSDILLQLHISERTGRGVKIIVDRLGKKVYEFGNNYIQVTIPYNRIGAVKFNVGNKIGNKIGNKLSTIQEQILSEIRNNPNINIAKLASSINVSHTAIENNIRVMKKIKIIKRCGAKKNGYWEVINNL